MPPLISTWLLLPFLWLTGAWPQPPVTIGKLELDETLLLQISYQVDDSRHDFMTSRSHLVTLERQGQVLLATEEDEGSGRVLATLPILAETADRVVVDFNAGFDKVSIEEDRTGEDYYRPIETLGDAFLRLSERRVVAVEEDGQTLVVQQTGLDDERDPVRVQYYLSPYRPSRRFEPIEIEGLEHFGVYETYPQPGVGRNVFYGMKFGVDRPIVFALSSAFPAAYRQAARDGAAYWNRAFGTPLVRVIDAPDGVTAPDLDYNVIQWGDTKTNSHIQGDPLTGEILHAHIFISSTETERGDLDAQRDHLRYIVAHEVGHALGLRHNFARGPLSTVMNYFSFDDTVRIGRDLIAAEAAPLEYDRQVARHVYFQEPLDLETLPAFCTDAQAGCGR